MCYWATLFQVVFKKNRYNSFFFLFLNSVNFKSSKTHFQSLLDYGLSPKLAFFYCNSTTYS